MIIWFGHSEDVSIILINSYDDDITHRKTVIFIKDVWSSHLFIVVIFEIKTTNHQSIYQTINPYIGA